jgi:hypothetical protein
MNKSSMKERPESSATAPGGPTTSNQSAANTPNRSAIVFKFNKSKKETSGGSSNSNSDPASQHASLTSTPRKKIEKLNYKTGTDILEAYKSKYKNSVTLNSVDLVDAQVKLLTSQASKEADVIKSHDESLEFIKDVNEESANGGEKTGSIMRSLKDSIKSKMRRVVEEKRALLEADQNEEIELNVLESEIKKPGSDAPTTSGAVDDEECSLEKKDSKKAKLKKIVFV